MRSEAAAYDTEMWLSSSAAAMAKRNITVETDVLSVCVPVIIFYDCEVNEQVSVALHSYCIWYSYGLYLTSRAKHKILLCLFRVYS